MSVGRSEPDGPAQNLSTQVHSKPIHLAQDEWKKIKPLWRRIKALLNYS